MAVRFSMSWDLIEGVKKLRELEKIAIENGCHVALGGSVLHKGHSAKDLDVFVYPHNAEKLFYIPDLMDLFASMLNPNGYGLCDDRYKERDSKTVYWLYDDRGWRIDFFFLGFNQANESQPLPPKEEKIFEDDVPF